MPVCRAAIETAVVISIYDTMFDTAGPRPVPVVRTLEVSYLAYGADTERLPGYQRAVE